MTVQIFMYSPTIQKLIDLFSKFPTVGPRTASRFVFYLLRLPKEKSDKLISAIAELKEKVKVCQSCFNPFEPSFAPAFANASAGKKATEGQGLAGELCEICSDPRRDKTLLCIVSNETDLTSIEKTKKYNGLYFILGGTVSALKKTDLEKLRIKELENLIKNRSEGEENKFSSSPFADAREIKEIILALNANSEGEATVLYLERFLKPFNKKTTRLGRGLPVGGELEYADQETLSSALEGRK